MSPFLIVKLIARPVWSLPDSTSLSPVEVMARQIFFLPKYLSTHPGHVHVQPAMADSGYPARPGRLHGRRRGGGVRRARLQLHRQGQAVRALRPPSSANMYRFHASGAKATRHPSINDAERKRLSNASRFSLGLGLGKSMFQWTISPPTGRMALRVGFEQRVSRF